MRLKKLKISKITILAVCLLVIAGIIFFYEEINEESFEIETVSVVVVTKDVKENTVLTSDFVKMESRYKVDISKQTDFILDYNDVIGKRTKVPLYEGEIVSKNRVIEDKPYMKDDDSKQISLNLAENDKAINIAGGDYIDMWIEPKAYEDDAEAENIIDARKVFEKLSVMVVRDANYQLKITDDFVPAFLTIQLNDDELKEFLEIDKNKYSIRITKYGEEKFYKAVNNFPLDEEGLK